MIAKFAVNLTEQMLQERLINPDKKEDYVYALVMSIEKFINISTIIIISIAANKVFPSILFLVCFYELRKRTGGYHAKTFFACYFETILTYIIILYINSSFMLPAVVLYGILGISCCILMLIGSINHPNMHMNQKELEAAKKSARIMLLLEVGVICFFSIADIDMVIIGYMVTAVAMCAISVCLAKILGQEVRGNEKA